MSFLRRYAVFLCSVMSVLSVACSTDSNTTAQVPQSGPPITTSDLVFPLNAIWATPFQVDPLLITTTTTTTRPRPTTSLPSAVAPDVPLSSETEPTRQASACGGWRDLISAHFPANQVDKACRVMMCESKGNPNALNGNPKYQAAGLFQIIKQWATRYGEVTGVPYYDGRFDPSANVRFAAWLWRAEGWGQWVCRG